jgi:signal transduction histidine kinase
MKLFFLRLAVKEHHNKVVIIVENEGTGFDEQEKKNLFERFPIINNQISSTKNLSNLQLPLIKDLVEAHHGKITAESKGENRGSTFIVELPIVE